MRLNFKKLVSVMLAVVCIFTFSAEVFAGDKRTLEFPNAGTNYVTIKGDNSSDLFSDTYVIKIYGLIDSVTVSKIKNCSITKRSYDKSTGVYTIKFKVNGFTYGKVLLKIKSQSDISVSTTEDEVSLWKGNCY